MYAIYIKGRDLVNFVSLFKTVIAPDERTLKNGFACFDVGLF